MKPIFLITILVLVLFSCKKSTEPEEQSSFRYPVAIGNEWQYTRIVSFSNIQPDTISHESFMPDTSYEETTITGRELLRDSIQTYSFETLYEDDYHSIISTHYYAYKNTGLYLIGYKNLSGVSCVPKNSIFKGKRIIFKGRFYRSVHELSQSIQSLSPLYKLTSDSVFFEDPPLLSLKYPFKIGEAWTYRENYNPWRIDKKILGKELIAISAGNFSCYKIVWLYDIDHDGSWDEDIMFTDYISSEGLIRRIIMYMNIIISDEQGNHLGTFDSQDFYSLTAYTIN